MTTTKPFLAICVVAPSMGCLDNWLPLLHEWKIARRQQVIFLFPDPNILHAALQGATNYHLAGKLFAPVILRTWNGDWAEFATIDDAHSHLQASAPTVAHRLWARLTRTQTGRKDYCPADSDTTLWQILRAKLRRYPLSCVWCDLYCLNKPYLSDVKTHFNDLPLFSVGHGVNVPVPRDNGNHTKSSDPIRNCHAYLFSAQEAFNYQRKYGLTPRQLTCVGIPKHNLDWLTTVSAVRTRKDEKLPKHYIGVVSRQPEAFMPRRRKVRTLKGIATLARTKGLPVVYTTHPSEVIKRSCLHTLINGTEFPPDWIHSEMSWLTLGQNAVAVFTLHSSVTVDCAWLGVPTVEWLDLQGLPCVDNSCALRDRNGRPILEYRYHGLTTGVNDRRDAQLALDRIFDDPDGYTKRQKKAYDQLFQTHMPCHAIVSDIITRTQQHYSGRHHQIRS